jgi:hypothetical protein
MTTIKTVIGTNNSNKNIGRAILRFEELSNPFS